MRVEPADHRQDGEDEEDPAPDREVAGALISDIECGAQDRKEPDIDAFRTDAARAKRMPSEEQSFRLLRLNQQVAMTSSLITRADWQAAEGCGFSPGEAIYLGLDMSLTTDLCALVAVSAEDGSRVASWFWKPEDTLFDHEAKDRVPYSVWKKSGHLETTPGRTVNPQAIAMKIAELTSEFQVVALTYDRWRIDTLLREFDRIGFEVQEGPGAGLRIESFGQGFKDMVPAIDAFENAVLTGELRHDGNPVLTNCVMNATATTDPAGNRKLVKDKARFRIDGAVALTMALGQKAKRTRVHYGSQPLVRPELLDDCDLTGADAETA